MSADTNAGGWPDAEKPGVPLNPERDGWHWLHHPEDLRPCPIPWDAEHAAWCSSGMHSPQGVIDLGYRYLGPCPTPQEVAAREAAAALAMRDKLCAYIDNSGPYFSLADLRALPLPASAQAALDAVVREAVERHGLEALITDDYLEVEAAIAAAIRALQPPADLAAEAPGDAVAFVPCTPDRECTDAGGPHCRCARAGA